MHKSLRIKEPWIVGVGASAGGLEALENFFKHVPLDSGMTYVVIQHLSPDFKSLMDELLSRHTKLRIERVEKTVTIKPNSIYLIPAKKNLDIKGVKLIPSDQNQTNKLRLPIDHFFTSLAEQHGPRSIGVVLSGTGCDGTRGAAAIKARDGFIAVQKPATCQFDGMPASVIRQSLHDTILSPQDIPAHLIKHTQEFTIDSDFAELESNPDLLREITDLLQTVEGLNFGDYRNSTVARRIDRRMKMTQHANVKSYISFLRKSKGELQVLHNEILIGVTRFFRDNPEFTFLQKTIIPKIFKQALENGDDTIRVWIAGCSTGEEAYSIAICLFEYMHANDAMLAIKIFATDVDRQAITIGTLGEYPNKIVEVLDNEIVDKYFIKKRHGYVVRSRLRKSIIFTYHNATKDPPFTNVHLISCRNVLIYFQPSLQAKTLAIFHFGLMNHGILFLGKSESLGQLSGEFKSLSQSYNFFEKMRNVKLALANDIKVNRPYRPLGYQSERTKEIGANVQVERKDPPLDKAYEMLLGRYVPPCILIDENYHLLHVFGDASRLLNFPVGKITLDVMKVLEKNLSLALSTALMRAERSEKEVLLTDIRTHRDDKNVFNLRVLPFLTRDIDRPQIYMITFERHDKKSLCPDVEGESFNSNTHAIEQISNLEEQLQSSKETLQATIEELETTNEELQSANEELMSSNEELQSSNEELHSVNEELYTVNAEHQSRIKEISETNRDIDFLLSSSKIATMFLDKGLLIRRYNKEMQSLIGVMEHDIGRPITDLIFNVANEKIVNQILSVCNTGQSLSQNIVKKGKTYLVKAVAYPSPKLQKNRQKSREKHGIVLSFIDVSFANQVNDLKRLTEDAEEFNYIVSRDLQKPIRRLGDSASQLRQTITSHTDIPSANIEAPIRQIEENLLLFSQMHSELLRYSRLRTQGAKFKKFKPKDAVTKVLENFSHRPEKFEVMVSDLPESLFGDASQFKELVTHILDNAIVHHGLRKDIVVKISAKKKDTYWHFSIQDNGGGFRDLDKKKIFQIFYAGPKKRSTRNLGVGLALSKRIVHRHGGEIWIDSSKQPGSTVCFSIPETAKPQF